MRRKLLAAAAVGVGAALLALLLGRVPALRGFALKAGDLQRRVLADPARADRRILLVEVDQGSIDHFERDTISFPWPRSLYNPLLAYCAAAGAEAVLFDVLFNDLSPWGEDVDAEFARGIRDSGRVWLAAAFPGGEGAPLAASFGLPLSGEPPAGLRRDAVSPPLPVIAEAAAGLGAVTLRPDPDGVFRRVPAGVVSGGRFLPVLGASPLVAKAGTAVFGPGTVSFGELALPVDRDGRLLPRFHGPRTVYRRVSAAGLIASGIAASSGERPAVSPEELRGAYVIVGYTAPGLLDMKPTPLAASEPAFGVHAAVLDNALNGDFLREAPPALSGALALALALALAAAVLLLPVPWAALACTAAAGALAAACAAAYGGGLLLDLWSAAVAGGLAVVGSAVVRYETEGRQRRFIAGAFSRYVSPKVVSQILEDPRRLALGGEKREVTLFFSDLQGFTSISERMGPQEVVAFLNEYTTLMADVVYAHDGFIDKYIGDSVMAFWGAPLPQPDHARRAVLTALECEARLGPFCRRLEEGGGPKLVTRIGLNSGEAIVGNMGSRDRFDYTAIGDVVNQASRLEGTNKVYGTLILASGETWRAAGGAAFGRLVDRVRVKGKAEPVEIWEAMAVAGGESAAQRDLAGAYAAALADYQGRRWDEAIRRAEEILAAAPDGPSRTLLERARAFREAPPPEGWDGVWTLTSK